MPRYEYVCTACDKREERIVKMDDRNNQHCSCAKQMPLRKELSAPNFGNMNKQGSSVSTGNTSNELPENLPGIY